MSKNDDYEEKVKAFLDTLKFGFEDLILDKVGKDISNAIVDNVRDIAENTLYFKGKEGAIYGRIIANLEKEMGNMVGDIEVKK